MSATAARTRPYACRAGARLQARWYAAAEGRERAYQDYRAHRETCPDCRRFFRELARLDTGK